MGFVLFIATWFMIEALRIFLASVYSMNVLTVSLNGSIVAVLFLLAPVAYLLGLSHLRPPTLVVACAVLFVAFRLLLLLPLAVETVTVVSGLAVAFYLLFLVPYLATNLRLAGGAATAAAAVGLAFALDVALRALGRTVDPGAQPWSAAFLVPFGGLFLYLTWMADLPSLETTGRAWSRTVGIAGLGIGGFLSLTTIPLLYPPFLARWTMQPPTPLLASVLLGFCMGAYLAKMGLGPGRRSARWTGVLQALLLVFAFDLGVGGSPITFLLTYFAAVASITGLERILGSLAAVRPSVRSLGSVLALACGIYLLALLAFVFTLTYAYVPASTLWRGRAPVILLLIAAVFVVPAVFVGGVAPSAAPTAASRRWLTGTIVVVLVLAAVGLAANTPVGPAAAVPSTVRVMTYNVHQGFSAHGILNPDRIAQVVRTASPDILALEESDTVRITSGGVDLVGYLASTLGYYVAYGPPTVAQTYGVSILSRFPIRTWNWTLLPSPGDNRVVVEVYLAVGGVDLHVFATHLGLDGAERDAQIARVLNLTALRPEPKILLGDFNACPEGLCPEPGATSDHVYEQITLSGWTDAWPAGDPAAPIVQSYTYDSVRPFERIDYIFVLPQRISVSGAFVGGQCVVRVGSVVCPTISPLDASDHLPVAADVSFA